MNREKIDSKKYKHFYKIVIYKKDVCVHLIFAMVASAWDFGGSPDISSCLPSVWGDTSIQQGWVGPTSY